MEIGRCPRCSAPYSASEIAGFGILRSRAARAGGPRMEYTCQECGRLIHLIPHGDGRYAPPGEPPPPSVPAQERVPPWMQGRRPETHAAPGAEETPFQEIPLQDEPPSPPPTADADEEAPLDAATALDLLGITPGADREAIERAFRERSLTCHPDKVAHLDAEFQALAERKFKRLRRAYELLLG
ncbi:MAG: J domain-containing protein [Planctomycetota bacterium]|nr:J domain-containing protein [Planctomycetota bacterium]